MNQPNIFIQTGYAGPGLLRLNIVADNVPENFLGIAFHLKIKGMEWKLEKFGAGGLLKNTDALVLAAEKLFQDGTKEIVFGESLKNGQKLLGGGSGGELATIFLSTGNAKGDLQFEFTDEHFSVYEAGRRDLKEVVWQDSGYREAEDLQTANAQAANLQLADFQANSLTKTDFDSLAGIYLFLGLTLLLAVLAFVGYLFVRRNASKP
jgi:hypothetical protein